MVLYMWDYLKIKEALPYSQQQLKHIRNEYLFVKRVSYEFS